MSPPGALSDQLQNKPQCLWHGQSSCSKGCSASQSSHEHTGHSPGRWETAAGSRQNRAALLERTEQDAQVTMPQPLHHHRALCQAAQAELVAMTCPSTIPVTIRYAKAEQQGKPWNLVVGWQLGAGGEVDEGNYSISTFTLPAGSPQAA